MEIMNFVLKELVILIVALNVIGTTLKNSKVKDNLIPLILLPFSIIGAVLIIGALDVNSIIQGILCWGMSIGLHQTIVVQPKK